MTLTEKKIANPLNFYRMPGEVEADDTLSMEEKIKVWTSWLNDIELRENAEAENMPSKEHFEAQSSSGHYIAVIETYLRKYNARK
ncbi:MAG TPA: hypothetical protein VHD33_00530 [Legionellaceae bacterium]|nr:hypothetical protein [Legionellaceae bacterium]